EAKRLFALLGSGGIVGGSTGGFLAEWIAENLGTDATMLFMMAFLVICAILVQFIWKQRPAKLDDEDRLATEQERPRNLAESFQLVRQSRHLLAIGALICLSSVVTTVAGWQFKAYAKD